MFFLFSSRKIRPQSSRFIKQEIYRFLLHVMLNFLIKLDKGIGSKLYLGAVRKHLPDPPYNSCEFQVVR